MAPPQAAARLSEAAVDRPTRMQVVQPVTEYADRKEVEAFAGALTESHLLCRELGHNWRPYWAAFNRAGRYYDRVLRCPRCKTERHQVMSKSGAIVSNVYKYPEGYEAKGLGRIVGEGRDALRIESMLRTIEKPSMAPPEGAQKSPSNRKANNGK